MKLRFFIIPAVMAAVLLGQGIGGFSGRRGVTSTGQQSQPATPLTPAQLATRLIQQVTAFMKLDSAQSSVLAGTGLTTALTDNLTTLQSNDEMLKTDYAALSSEVIASPSGPPAAAPGIQTLLASNFQIRVADAGAVVYALQSLAVPLSAEQTANLPKLVEMLVRQN